MEYSASKVLQSRTPAPNLPAARWPNVPFATVPVQGGQRTLYMDIHRSEAPGPQPVVVYVYGGGWYYGEHTNAKNRNLFYMRLLSDLVPRGVAVAAIEYRRGVEAAFPAQLHDVKGAVRFLRANAAEYGLDAARIAMLGESAGGHLTALMALTANHPELEGESGGNVGVSSTLTAAVDLFGPTDLLSYMDEYDTEFLAPDAPMVMPLRDYPPEEWPLHTPDAMLLHYEGPGRSTRALMGVAQTGDTTHPDWPYVELARMASPMTYAAAAGDCCPLLIAHGQHDLLLPVKQSERLYQALCHAGADVYYLTRNLATHGPSLGDFCDSAITEFLYRHLQQVQP